MRFAWWITRTSEALTHIQYSHIPLTVSSHLANPKAFQVFKMHQRTSLVVQWLKLCASDAGGPCSIPGQGTRFHVPQLRHGVAKYFFNAPSFFLLQNLCIYHPLYSIWSSLTPNLTWSPSPLLYHFQSSLFLPSQSIIIFTFMVT